METRLRGTEPAQNGENDVCIRPREGNFARFRRQASQFEARLCPKPEPTAVPVAAVSVPPTQIPSAAHTPRGIVKHTDEIDLTIGQ